MYPPPRFGLRASLVPLFRKRFIPALCLGSFRKPPSAQSPFARLGCYLWRRDIQHLVRRRYPSFIAHTNSCVRPNSSCRLQIFPIRPVFAGCCQPLLGDGPSRRYLHNLCKVAWTRTPPRSRDFLSVWDASLTLWRSKSQDIGLSLEQTGSARELSL